VSIRMEEQGGDASKSEGHARVKVRMGGGVEKMEIKG
jgi:hypothetical protein